MLDYLKEYGHLTFADAPVNDVDRLVFAQLAYMDFASVGKKDCSLSEALAHAAFADSNDPSEDRFFFQKKDDRRLSELSNCPRYADIRFGGFLRHFDPVMETQFAALSLWLTGDHLLIAFRGTDNTLAGWKEDFNMAFMDEIPAQRMALDYLNSMEGPAQTITLCGHSKGGNLALYACSACSCSIRQKIDLALSFDGPGLNDRLIQSEGFRKTQDRMRVIMPRGSLVGLLFEQPENVRIVDSRAFSTLQHYPYFWKIDKMDFIYLARNSRVGALLGKTVCGLMERLDQSARERLVEVVYEVISASEADTFNAMAASALKSASGIAASLSRTDAETRRFFLTALQAILASFAEALGIRGGENR